MPPELDPTPAPTPVVDPAPAPEPDNFADAFAKLALEDGDANNLNLDPQKPADPAPADPVDPAPADPAPADPAPADPAPAPTPTPAPADEDDAVLKKLADLVKNQPAPKAEPAPAPTPAAEPEPEIYTAEEKEFLAGYEKDWPDVVRAESLKRRAEYRQLTGYVFDQVRAVLAPLQETVQQLAGHTQLSELTRQVPGYSDDLRSQVTEWANNQPTYLQVAYNHVITNGSVDEVADLVKRFRSETGVSPAAQAAPAPAPKKDTELPTAAKQAAAALAPVSSKRTQVVQQDDPQDFDSAFAAFASKGI